MSKKLFHIMSLFVLLGVLLALSVSAVAAQSLPTVTIRATDPFAKEATDKGQFTVYRSPSSASLSPLTVYYIVGGTAANGVDYVTLTGTVTIPGGAVSAPIIVTPREDTVRELPETVIVKITDPCFGPTGCIYNIGTPSSATVTIYDND